MPGFIVHAGASINCSHGGRALPAIPPQCTVLVCGQPVVTQPTGHIIIGCANPANAGGPCVRANWLTASTKVFVKYQRVLLLDSQGLATPTGVPVAVTSTQLRVTAV